MIVIVGNCQDKKDITSVDITIVMVEMIEIKRSEDQRINLGHDREIEEENIKQKEEEDNLLPEKEIHNKEEI